MSARPYSTPASDGPPRSPTLLDEDGVVTPRIIEAMTRTRPWLTLFVVLGYLGAGVLALVGISIVLAPPKGFLGGRLFGLAHLVGVGIYGVGANLLNRYRTSITSVERGYGIQALENAMEHQKSFWRFMGISCAVVLGLWVVIVVGVTGFAIANHL